MEAIRVAVLGAGALGRVHIQRFMEDPNVQVVAVYDPNPQSLAQGLSAAQGKAAACLQLEEVWDHHPNTICIASPDGEHVNQVMASLSQGCHVLCEKPLTPSLNEYEAVLNALSASGLQMSLTYPRRYDPDIREVRCRVHSGDFGELLSATVSNVEDWITPNVGTWRHDPLICPGGFFYDANGHQLDFTFWITGLQAKWVEARSWNVGTPVPIRVHGQAELSNGAPMAFHFDGHGATWRERIDLHFEQADVLLIDGKPFVAQGGLLQAVESGAPGENAVSAFIEMIRDGGPNRAAVNEFEGLIRFTQCALRSAEQGGERVNLSVNEAK